MKKTAVILFNLGGPDRPEAVKPFLFNLFNDSAIIRLPQPLRFLIAKIISGKREKIAQDIYAKIGGGSPILENTRIQAEMLERALGSKPGIKCFVAMRYWHPFAVETAEEVKKFAPDEMLLLPLYPQFSTTTTASSLKGWRKAVNKAGVQRPTKTICCYPTEPGFIRALAEQIRTSMKEASVHGKPRLLFSAHGLPEKIVQAGDPYPWQCEQTAAALVRELAIDGLDWVLCYQSRVGPLKWIGPSTDDEVRRAGNDKVPVIIAPIAFVSEHSETLVEIDMEYRHMALQAGSPFFAYTGAVSGAPVFIEGLAKLVRNALASDTDCASAAGGRICPPAFSGCCQKPDSRNV
jgi:protoporphyrin/coproporphyrin ferrochelatase